MLKMRVICRHEDKYICILNDEKVVIIPEIDVLRHKISGIDFTDLTKLETFKDDPESSAMVFYYERGYNNSIMKLSHTDNNGNVLVIREKQTSEGTTLSIDLPRLDSIFIQGHACNDVERLDIHIPIGMQLTIKYPEISLKRLNCITGNTGYIVYKSNYIDFDISKLMFMILSKSVMKSILPDPEIDIIMQTDNFCLRKLDIRIPRRLEYDIRKR